MSPGTGPGTTARRQGEVADYLAAVRVALADLDAGTRDGLMEDLPEHVAEVAAADGAPLRVRLGTPAAFAAELRSAAGLDGVPGSVDPMTLRTKAASELAREFSDRVIARMLGYDTTSELLLALQPAWWIVRGAAVAAVYLRFWRGTSARDFALLVVAAIGGGISLRLGRMMTRGSAGSRLASAVISAMCVLPVCYVTFWLIIW